MSTTTIRVAADTRDTVNRLRKLTGYSTDSVIEKALAAYEESLFWQAWRQAQPLADIDDLQLWDNASWIDAATDHAADPHS